MNTNNNNNNIPYGIEKFEGSFDKEELGATIVLNKSVNEIKNPAALGVYIYLLTRPKEWKLNVKQLANHFECDKEKMYGILNYLLENKFVSRTIIKQKGRFSSYHHHVYLSRFSAENHSVDLEIACSKTQSGIDSSPYPGFPETVFPETENPDTYKTKNIKNKDINKISTSDEVADFSYIDLVYLKAEFEKADESNSYVNQDLNSQCDAQVIDGEPIYNKSNSSYNQTKNQRVSKSNVTYGLKEIQSENTFQIPDQMIQDWIANRKKKRAPITQTAWRKIIKELTKCKEQGIDPVESFETMVASSWQSLKVEYFQTKDSVAKQEAAKKRSIELEQAALKRKEREIEDSQRIRGIVSTASENERGKLRKLLGSRAPEMIGSHNALR